MTCCCRYCHLVLQALVNLEESGVLEGYRASRLEQLQSDAAMLICNLQVWLAAAAAASLLQWLAGWLASWPYLVCSAGQLRTIRFRAGRQAASKPGGALWWVSGKMPPHTPSHQHCLSVLSSLPFHCRAWALRALPRRLVLASSLQPPPSTTPAAPTATP